jgi:hypothetical protein
MMIGMGTPSRKSRIERIVKVSYTRLTAVHIGAPTGVTRLNELHVIPLPTANCRGIARAKRAD